MADGSSTLLEFCHSCLALNNLGVTLLEKGRFRAATMALNAAISALKTTASHVYGDGADADYLRDEHLHILRKRLAKATTWAAQASKKHMPCGTEVLPLDNDDVGALDRAQQDGPSASLVFPIRFRHLPSPQSIRRGIDAQIITVVFYNAALAQMHLRYCRRPAGGDEGTLALAKAARFFSIAHRALHYSIRQRQEGQQLQLQLPLQLRGIEHDSAVLPTDNIRVLCLSSLVLASWSVALRFQRAHDQVAQIETTLQDIQHKRLEWERGMVLVPRDEPAAAAA